MTINNFELNKIVESSIKKYDIESKAFYNKLLKNENEKYKMIIKAEDLNPNIDTIKNKIMQFEDNFFNNIMNIEEFETELIITNANFIFKEKNNRYEIQIYDKEKDFEFVFDEYGEGKDVFSVKVINKENNCIATEDKVETIRHNSKFIERQVFSKYIEEFYLKDETKTLFLKKCLDKASCILSVIDYENLEKEKFNYLLIAFKQIEFNISEDINKSLKEVDDIFKLVFDYSVLTYKKGNKEKLIF